MSLQGERTLNIVRMIIQISFLYVLYLLGVFIQKTFHLFIPGSIIGMLLLFILLLTNVIKQDWIKAGSLLLIRYLPLFFVPVTVGIMNYLDLFKGKGLVIIVIVLISTILVMMGTGWISQWLVRRQEE
ncbi:CidA/LrgA family protein [Bacillus sp. FJAT-50079]|nr:CidA/LrgA family protein [Bacillus sp. FJAT-50079]